MREGRNAHNISSENLRVKDHLGKFYVDGRLILQWVFLKNKAWGV
jgi:hypothetical protein